MRETFGPISRLQRPAVFPLPQVLCVVGCKTGATSVESLTRLSARLDRMGGGR